ncbi:MAG: ATP-binding protein [Bacteroidales bacterium]|nr:ATP-binding protein [Bacteroidales bacterium]
MASKDKTGELLRENAELREIISRLERLTGKAEGSGFDIDELLNEKALLETLIDLTPESIVQTTMDGTVERVNREFTRQFGYTKEEALGKNINELIVPEELKKEAVSFTKKITGDETIKTEAEACIKTETYRVDKDGKKLYVSLIVQPAVIDGRINSLFAVYRNLSGKKKDDDTKSVMYNISAAALTMTEFSDIFNNIKEEISKIWDIKNFYIVLYNKEAQTLSLPYYQDEKDYFEEVPVKNTMTGWLIKENRPVLLKEADIDELEQKGEIALVGTPCKLWLGVPLSMENEIIGAMVLQDYNDAEAFTNDDLRLLSLIGNQIALAIQRKRMLNNLITERRKAEEAGRLKQQFMSTMSHEIRTPLNEVIGISNLLLEGDPRPDQMEFVKTLRFSADHLLTLVNDVLDYTKMEAGSISFEKTKFDISEFVNDLKRSYTFQTETKDLEFILSMDKKIPGDLIGDPIRLNQILSNLLSNAVKFTSEGTIEMGVKEISRSGNEIKLKFNVRDTGIGIPRDKQSVIFESFKQASDDTTRKFGGTGLGLSISKKLVELQGGSLDVESQQGVGSNFFFSLNFLIATDEERAQKTGEEDQRWDELIGKNILIAEDNKINFFVANKFLTKWEINVTHAENGKIALDYIRDNKYDLILMDLHMPEMDGIEATEIIRNSDDPEIKNLPVIALTAAIMSEHEAKIEKLNINDYILKPFKPRDLYSKILRHTR